MLKKVIIVYNPRSSKFQAVEREILAPARKVKGWLVGKYEVKPTDVDDNAAKLAKILNDGDLVIAAGGDGTAVIAVNGIMLSKKDVTLSVFGYGNFNDIARTLKSKRPVEYGGEYVGGVMEVLEKFEAGKVKDYYPLAVTVDQKHWRYVPCYMTLGLFAESVAVFDDDKVRKHLRKGKRSLVFSIFSLASWYFKNKKQKFLPEGKVEQELVSGPGMIEKETVITEKTTDYLAINGPSVARLMKGNKMFIKPEGFRSTTAKLGGFWSLCWFMMRSILCRIPGKKTQKDVIKFDEPSSVEIHAEGEYKKLELVTEIRVEKAERALKVVLA